MFFVAQVGLEPTPLSGPAFEAGESANSSTEPYCPWGGT